MAVICVDVGTTVIKAVGYDEDGAETVIVRRSTTVLRPTPARAEQDMTEVWDHVASAVRDVVGRLPGPIGYVAVTAQGDGCWLVDGHGEPTGPAILWNDGRAASIVGAWSRAGVLAAAFALNGSLTFAGLPNAVLSWLRVHDPDRLDRSAAALSCSGWIFQRLTGEVVMDESDASAPFLDIRTRTYSPRLLELYDLAWAERLLPPIIGDDQRVRPLGPDAAQRTGLPVGTPVVLCPYDVAATAIGVGAIRPGQAASILGTTLCTEVVTAAADTGAEPAGLTVSLGAEGRYLRAFPTLAGGEVIRWACDLLHLDAPGQLTELALQADPGAAGLLFLPYLSPAGERAPFLDPLIRGTMLGLSLHHRRADLARAVLEGLTFVVADCLAAAPVRPTDLRVTGGGAASAGWLQLIADVTGVPALRSADAESGARGAFLVGQVATGAARSLATAAERHVRIRDTFRPDPAATATYAPSFAAFRDLRPALTAVGPRLAALREHLESPTEQAVHS
ncbi:FGGY family carbohydrate kinase [Micromonosporaceae bacterium Da 78-11]